MHPAIVAYAARVAWDRTPRAPSTDLAETTTLDVVGVPGTRSARVRVWASPTQTGVTVLELVADDGSTCSPLRHPVVVTVGDAPEGDLAPGAGMCIRTAHADWYEVTDHEPRLEVIRLDAGGHEVYGEAPRTHGWVMACALCGRTRFAPRRALERVTRCHVCTHQALCARRAVAQRAAYVPGTVRQQLGLIRGRAVELAQLGASLSEIAQACGRSVSWASRTTAATRAAMTAPKASAA